MNIQIAINYYNCPFIYLFWNRGGSKKKISAPRRQSPNCSSIFYCTGTIKSTTTIYYLPLQHLPLQHYHFNTSTLVSHYAMSSHYAQDIGLSIVQCGSVVMWQFCSVVVWYGSTVRSMNKFGYCSRGDGSRYFFFPLVLGVVVGCWCGGFLFFPLLLGTLFEKDVPWCFVSSCNGAPLSFPSHCLSGPQIQRGFLFGPLQVSLSHPPPPRSTTVLGRRTIPA